MATTNLLQWNPTAANQENDTAYAADSQRAGGATDPSLFLSPLANKVFYQMSTYLTALFTAFANKGFTTSDSNLSTLTAQCANFLTSADFRANLQAVAYAPNVAFDCAQAIGFSVGLTGNCNVNIINQQVGDVLVFLFAQDGAGGRSISFTGATVFGPVTLDPTPDAVTVMAYKVDTVGHLLPLAPLMSDVNGIVGTPIGAAQPASGAFTTLASTGLATLSQLTLDVPGSAGQVLTNTGGVFVPANIPSAPCTVNDVTGSRSLGMAYRNTSGKTMRVYGNCLTTGSSVGSLVFLIGASSPTTELWGNENTASVSSARAGFVGEVPNGWYYQLNATGDITGVNRWMELLS